jgi:fumarylacetoacetate (FAA) hydrolase
MKLASLKQGRDGRLVVVSDDLKWSIDASSIAPTMQDALDRWDSCEQPLRALSQSLNSPRGGDAREPFDQRNAASPLPRAYQWVDGSAYVNHVVLVRQARGATMPERFWTDPLMYQGGSDGFLGPCDSIPLADESWGCDLEGEIAVIVDDVRQGVSREGALDHIKLVMLANDVSLRNLIPGELEKGFGFYQSKPASAFSPVAVTPDALGSAWREGKLHLPLHVTLRGEAFGRANAGVDMTFDFGTLVAHAAKTRDLCAGTIVGSGTVSNRDADGGPGKSITEGGAGYSCIAEIRMVEMIRLGEPRTRFLANGDRVALEVFDESGRSIFGRIDQIVATP